MTCKEKLVLEHPEHLNPNLWAGVDTCPTEFGYADKPAYCNDETLTCDERCTMCWDREIPETENIKKENVIMTPTKMTKADLIEEIKLAHEHIQNMETQIKNLERYKQYEDMANEFKAMHTAFINSGFTNEQAFEMIKMLTQAVVPTALRGMGL